MSSVPPGPSGRELPASPTAVGRERELGQIDALIGGLPRGQGGVVLFSGEAGVGKTRLLGEALRRAGAGGVTTLRVACQDRDRELPYAAWSELIRNYVGTTPRATAYRTMRLHLPALAKLAPELADQIWLYDPSVPPLEGGPRQFTRALAQFFYGLAAEAPTLLVLDDLGWMDVASLELLEVVAGQCAGIPLGIVTAYRDAHLAENPGLSALLRALTLDPSYTRTTLPRLTPEQSRAMIGDLLGRADIDRKLTDAVFDRTRGNPFYTREVLQGLVDAGDLRSGAGGWEVRSGATVHLPPTIAATIEARVARMDPNAARVLRVASLLGIEFSYALLDQVAGESQATLLAALEEAVRVRLLAEKAASDPGPGYAFCHPLIQEVLAGGVGAARATAVHRRAAEVLETQFGKEVRGRSATLAYHYLRASDRPRALSSSIAAGDEAAAVFARSEAAVHFRTALGLLEGSSDGRMIAAVEERLADQLRWLAQLLEAKRRYVTAGRRWEELGEVAKAADCYLRGADLFQGSFEEEQKLRERAGELLKSQPPGPALCRWYLSHGLVELDRTHVGEAAADYERALALARNASDPSGQVIALTRLAHCVLGDRREDFLRLTDEAEALILTHHLAELHSLISLNRCIYYYQVTGDLRACLRESSVALERIRAAGDLETEGWWMGFALPWLKLRMGPLSEARDGVESRFRTADFLSHPGLTPEADENALRAWVRTLTGPLDEAEHLLTVAEELGRHRPNWFDDGMNLQFRGRLEVLRGDVRKAASFFEAAAASYFSADSPAWHLLFACECLEQMVRTLVDLQELERARTQLERLEGKSAILRSEAADALALRARAAFLRATGDPKGALERLDRVRDIHDRLGWSYDLGTDDVERGRTLLIAGDRARARTAFETALERFRSIGAAPDARKVEGLIATLTL